MIVGALLAVAAGRDLLAAPRLDEPRAHRPRPRRPALGLHGQRRAPGARWRAAASSLTPEERHPPALAAPPTPRPRRCARAAARPTALPASSPIREALGAAPGLARPADVPPPGRAGCRPRAARSSSSPTACRSTAWTPARPSPCSLAPRPRDAWRRARAGPGPGADERFVISRRHAPSGRATDLRSLTLRDGRDSRRKAFPDMTPKATFLRPVPVAATALAAVTGAWLAWSPVAGADTRSPARSPTWSSAPARPW